MTTDPFKIAFIFKNRECTMPANSVLREYLQYMLDNYPEDLHFLWKKSQEYSNFGGASTYTFQRWLQKLKKDIKI